MPKQFPALPRKSTEGVGNDGPLMTCGWLQLVELKSTSHRRAIVPHPCCSACAGLPFPYALIKTRKGTFKSTGLFFCLLLFLSSSPPLLFQRDGSALALPDNAPLHAGASTHPAPGSVGPEQDPPDQKPSLAPPRPITWRPAPCPASTWRLRPAAAAADG